ELESDRQTVLSEAAGHADRRQTAHVPDPADGIGKRESEVEVRVQFAGCERQRSANQNVYIVKQLVHFFLEDAANPLRKYEIRRAYFFVHVSADLAQRIVEFGYLS